MWNLATAPAWSNLIHVTLWENDGRLHPFHNFSRSNAFSNNLIKMKFILPKIFFQTSMLLNNKTSWMFFNLHWKNCEKPFVGGHDRFEGTGRLATKINITFFVRNEVLNTFHLTIFLKRTIISKINFWNAWPIFKEWGIRKYKWIQPFL